MITESLGTVTSCMALSQFITLPVTPCCSP
jgi:hypothetical protein